MHPNRIKWDDMIKEMTLIKQNSKDDYIMKVGAKPPLLSQR